MACSIYCDNAAAAIDWLCTAFGFEVRLKVEGDGGSIHHSELTFGEAVIMVAEAGGQDSKGRDTTYCKSPRSLDGANTQGIMFYLDDVEAHCAHARAAGAVITVEPTTSDYGEDYWSDRSYQARDPEGHHWWFCQRLRSPVPKS
jgi:uncharacterized glyoxalase superfamily protein PhnB